MIRTGTQGWSYKDWLGNFYPEDCRPADYLSIYARRFNTVEIDATFYAIPRKSTVEKWYDNTPRDFKFAAKFPRLITHESDLTNIEDVLSGFLSTMTALKEKLGPLLIQFPYSFKPDMAENLYKFLKLLPAEFNFAIEVRNKKWLGDSFYDKLRENNIGLAILDHPWMPKTSVKTSNFVYLRFLGDRKSIPDNFSHERRDRKQELIEWREFINTLIEQKEDVYAYFNNHYSGHSPTTAERFIKMMAES